MKKDQIRRTKSAKRRVARHPSHRPAPAPRSSLPEVVALVVVTVFGLGLVFIFQGSPDLWDLWQARARYGVRWSGAGCG